jgi:hypothetical protein
MRIAAVVLNWHGADLTVAATRSLRHDVTHVFVVDNASGGDELEKLAPIAGLPNVTVTVNASNQGYAGGCNRGIELALVGGYDAILVVNNDAVARPGAIEKLAARLATEPGVGAVGPAVVQTGTERLLHTTCRFDCATGTHGWQHRDAELVQLSASPLETDYISGEAFLVRAEVLSSCGTFDERFFCYFEDVDWGLRVRDAGWRLEVVPDAIFDHVLSASSAGVIGAYYRARNRVLMLRITLGHSRLRATRLSARGELRALASSARRWRLREAIRGVLLGWVVGVLKRVQI